MNKRELYALLDIESPEEFEYFENLADYLECEEELDYTDVAELFNGVDKDVLAQLCDNYFEEISGFVPGSQTEVFTIFENVRRALVGMCRNCSDDENLEAKGVAHTCWNCGKTVQVPNKIIIGKNRVLLNQNTKLLHHHVYDDFDMDTVVGSVVQNPKNPALWGIRNEDKVNWTYQKADGTQIPVAPGKTAGIAKGVKIIFPESTGEFK